jgi:threonine/homoserine/homoserine lactone efflux protein
MIPPPPVIDGLRTGMMLQLAIGPIFFYLVSIGMESTLMNSLLAVLAVTIADCLYIGLSLIGIGRLLQKEQVKRRFGTFSSVVLMLFGIVIFSRAWAQVGAFGRSSTLAWTPLSSFASTFILTISSPLTIVFWSSIFSAKAIENDYRKQELTSFAIGAGTATPLFLGIAVSLVFLLQTAIPDWLVQLMNGLVGLVLIYYGFSRTFTFSRSSRQQGR